MHYLERRRNLQLASTAPSSSRKTVCRKREVSDTPSVMTDVLSQHYAEVSRYFSGLLCLFANHLEGDGSGKED